MVYLGSVAEVMYPNLVVKQKKCLTEYCHQLKHKRGAAGEILQKMKQLKKEKSHQNFLTEKLLASNY